MKWSKIIKKAIMLTVLSVITIVILMVIASFGMKHIFTGVQSYIITLFIVFYPLIIDYKVDKRYNLKQFVSREFISLIPLVFFILFISAMVKVLPPMSDDARFSFFEIFMTFLFVTLLMKVVKIFEYIKKV